MKVVVVTPWFPTQQDPIAGVFNLRDVELLAKTHSVTVLHLLSPPATRGLRLHEDGVAVEGVEVIRVPYRQLDPVTTLTATRAIREHLVEADIVHTMAAHATMLVRLAQPRIPWVHTEHWSALIHQNTSLRKRIARRLYAPFLRYPDSVVTVSRALADAVGRYRDRPPIVVGNWVRHGPDRQVLAALTRGSESGALKIIAVGRVVREKGPIEAVNTIAELRDRGVDAHLVWVGDGPMLASARRHALNLKIERHVDFVGAIQPHRISGLLLRSHLFLLPTASETFGIAVAEALSHGLPVVTTGSGGHLDFLPPQASRVADRSDTIAIADAVQDLLADPNRWNAVQVSEHARRQFSDDSRQERYALAYEEALSEFRSRGARGPSVIRRRVAEGRLRRNAVRDTQSC